MALEGGERLGHRWRQRVRGRRGLPGIPHGPSLHPKRPADPEQARRQAIANNFAYDTPIELKFDMG